MLAKSPGFTIIAVLTLALGIGANTAIFGLIDAVMLRALPAANPSELVLLRWSARKGPEIHGYMSSGDCPSNLRFGAANPAGCSFSEPLVRVISKSNAFSGVAAFANTGRLDLTGNGPATVITGQTVNGDFFPTLGVKAAVGRMIETSDDVPTASSVAVLNYGYWQSAFGGSRDAVGRTIQLNGVPFTIIGVAEQKFIGLTPGSDYDVWIPLVDEQRVTNEALWQNRQDDITYWWLTIVGRLKPGASVPQTQAQVTGVFANEVLHEAVSMFEPGGMPGRGGPGGGGAVVRRQVVIGGAGAPPPGAAPGMGPGGPGQGPGPTKGGNMAYGYGPMGGPGPGQVPNEGKQVAKQPSKTPNEVGQPVRMAQAAAPPAGLKGPGSGPGAGPSAGPSKKAPREQPSAEANEQATLLAPGDAPAITLVPAQTGLTGARTQFTNPLYVLMLAVGIILLIACANVAGLMLARSAARRREMAVRLALGAGRGRIMRQLVTESVLLSVTGGGLGIPLAYWGAHLIVSFVSKNQTRAMGFATGVDTRVLVFTAAVSILTGILFGMAPAFRGARVDLTPALKEGFGVATTSGHGRGKWFGAGNVLVVAQVALAIVVLVGAGLLVRTLQNLRSVDVGFDSHNLVVFNIDPSLAGYKGAQIDSFYRDLQGRLSETPGVKSASYSMIPLLSGNLMMTMFHWPGTPQDRESSANVLPVGRNFFQTMHIPLLLGRDFNSADYALANANSGHGGNAAPTPVIVNQAFVAKYCGKENCLGKPFGDEPGGYQIVGVVRDAKYAGLRQDNSATMYTPQSGMGAAFEVRTAADPQALLPAIRRVVAEINPDLPLFQVTTESEQIDRLLFQERLIARLSTFFGLLALVLASIGLYGLLSYDVARRTREIGIRMALGAQEGDVLRLVVKQGLALALVGAVVGVGVALGVTRYLASMLFDVKTNDPVTIVAVAVILGVVAFTACYIPARRATRVDPLVALRYE